MLRFVTCFKKLHPVECKHNTSQLRGSAKPHKSPVRWQNKGRGKCKTWRMKSQKVPDFKSPHVDYAALSQGGCFTMITLSHGCLQYRWLIIDQCADILTVLCFVQVFGSTTQCPCDGCGCSSSYCKSQDYSLAVLTVGTPWGLPPAAGAQKKGRGYWQAF